MYIFAAEMKYNWRKSVLTRANQRFLLYCGWNVDSRPHPRFLSRRSDLHKNKLGYVKRIIEFRNRHPPLLDQWFIVQIPVLCVVDVYHSNEKTSKYWIFSREILGVFLFVSFARSPSQWKEMNLSEKEEEIAKFREKQCFKKRSS